MVWVYTWYMNEKKLYSQYKKPQWAPPSWIFGPVWTLLYVLIAISFGYVAYLYSKDLVPFVVLLPFLLNLLFNFSFTPIQFRVQNMYLAFVDIVLVLVTLIWALVSVFEYAPWVSYINIPYLCWVSFATVLQTTVTLMNRR